MKREVEMKERQKIQTKTNDFVINFPSLGLRQIIWLLSWLPLASDKISNISASRLWFSEVNMMVKGEKGYEGLHLVTKHFPGLLILGCLLILLKGAKIRMKIRSNSSVSNSPPAQVLFWTIFAVFTSPPPKIKKKISCKGHTGISPKLRAP